MTEEQRVLANVLKTKPSRQHPHPQTSRDAFADHSPSTRGSGQQSEVVENEGIDEKADSGCEFRADTGSENKTFGGRRKRELDVEEERFSFLDNSQHSKTKIRSCNLFQDFHEMRLLKVQEVASLLGCSVKDIYTFSYECGLPTRRLGGRVRILGMDLQKWLERLPLKRSPLV